jgi:hypothetical protein
MIRSHFTIKIALVSGLLLAGQVHAAWYTPLFDFGRSLKTVVSSPKVIVGVSALLAGIYALNHYKILGHCNEYIVDRCNRYWDQRLRDAVVRRVDTLANAVRAGQYNGYKKPNEKLTAPVCVGRNRSTGISLTLNPRNRSGSPVIVTELDGSQRVVRARISTPLEPDKMRIIYEDEVANSQ